MAVGLPSPPPILADQGITPTGPIRVGGQGVMPGPTGTPCRSDRLSPSCLPPVPEQLPKQRRRRNASPRCNPHATNKSCCLCMDGSKNPAGPAAESAAIPAICRSTACMDPKPIHQRCTLQSKNPKNPGMPRSIQTAVMCSCSATCCTLQSKNPCHSWQRCTLQSHASTACNWIQAMSKNP